MDTLTAAGLRARRAGQILIEEIGAPGPESVVETAVRAVAVILELREQRQSLMAAARRLQAELADLRALHAGGGSLGECFLCGACSPEDADA